MRVAGMGCTLSEVCDVLLLLLLLLLQVAASADDLVPPGMRSVKWAAVEEIFRCVWECGVACCSQVMHAAMALGAAFPHCGGIPATSARQHPTTLESSKEATVVVLSSS